MSPSIGAYDLTRPDTQRWLNPHQADLLRLLGRLEMMSSAQIYTMVYRSHLTRRGMQRQLERLWNDGLVWRSTVRYGALPGHAGQAGPPTKFPYVYGLSLEGKALIDTMGLEHDQRSLDALRARDPRGRRVPAATLAHDLTVSWWCSSILLAARESRICHEVFVQTEFVVSEQQRLDALIVLRLRPDHPRPQAGTIPWFDGRACPPDAVEVRLGLEIDMGTEQLSVIAGKAIVTRDQQAAGLYTQLFGGPIRTIFVAPTRRRAAQIAAEWRSNWPETLACVATMASCEHRRYGTLWGDYRMLVDGTQPANLLNELVEGADRRVRPHRVISQEAWAANLESGSEAP